MVSIQLYQPGGINQQIEFPEEWNELTTDEVESIAKVMLSGFDDINLIKAAFFKEILRHRCCSDEMYDRLDPDQAVVDGLPLIEFILSGNQLSKQPYPVIIIEGRNFYGPESDFDNLQCGEYEDADIPYLRFLETTDPIHLAEMAAILYRPKGTPYITYSSQSDKNELYQADRFTRQFEKLPPWQLYSIYMWWTGTKTVMQQIFHHVYEKGSGKNEEVDYMAFTKCIHAAAGPKNGTRDQVRRTEIKAILFDMDEEARKAKELEQQYKK